MKGKVICVSERWNNTMMKRLGVFQRTQIVLSIAVIFGATLFFSISDIESHKLTHTAIFSECVERNGVSGSLERCQLLADNTMQLFADTNMGPQGILEYFAFSAGFVGLFWLIFHLCILYPIKWILAGRNHTITD